MASAAAEVIACCFALLALVVASAAAEVIASCFALSALLVASAAAEVIACCFALLALDVASAAAVLIASCLAVSTLVETSLTFRLISPFSALISVRVSVIVFISACCSEKEGVQTGAGRKPSTSITSVNFTELPRVEPAIPA